MSVRFRDMPAESKAAYLFCWAAGLTIAAIILGALVKLAIWVWSQ